MGIRAGAVALAGSAAQLAHTAADAAEAPMSGVRIGRTAGGGALGPGP